MTATDRVPPRRKPAGGEISLLFLFHALMSGGFLTAYLSGGEDSYGIHVFAGYTVIAALGLRLGAALLAPPGSPLRLPRPSAQATGHWLARLGRFDRAACAGRSPLIPWMSVLMLAGVAAAALTGAVADYLAAVEDLHEALGEVALVLAVVHGVLAFLLVGLKRLAGSAPALNKEILP